MSPLLTKSLDKYVGSRAAIDTAVNGAETALNYLRNQKREMDAVVRADVIEQLKEIFRDAIERKVWPSDCVVKLWQRLAVYPGESGACCVEVDTLCFRPLTEETARILRVAQETAEDLVAYVDGGETVTLTP